MAVAVKSTNWTKSSINQTNWTKVAVNQTSWEPDIIFSESGLLLQNGVDFLLYQNGNKIGLQA
jgi:hypothetical protein